MISDAIVLYLMAQILLIAINLIGYSRIPILSIIGLIGGILVAIPTLDAFGDDYLIAIIPILVNITIPIMSLASVWSGD